MTSTANVTRATHSAAIAALALALGLLVMVIGVGWASGSAEPSGSHGPHATVAGPYGEFAVAADHPHFENGSLPVVPDIVAEAVLPRAATALVALGLAVAIGLVALLWRPRLWRGVRGPPRGRGAVWSGRQRLTRMCIARR
ncbi:hypothetical protein MCHIJ_52430 [Mycolicibacterium chitae]|uniref:Uncharacterized protein n=1 Tax=Mycolicibacterium alvei TaxID=67081 RepID=A0A6N4USS7_9MYCO|nr:MULTISPECIES: hypothetical protein [Mycolicibacterium]MCV7003108.1 hypothetical protein [Mycolicibacterium alvei]MCV7107805.1 hypothetical protein [Mycolicibacterium chitae]BBX26923.1 hypothetical protein MALV_20480 [Mycolicibacterium alvei]BBZ05806.1 hypothetical protein MCHIJ_52430 [Mycolicibacterium chitae]